MITPIDISVFGKDPAADQKLFQDIFHFDGGKLTWKVKPSKGVRVGTEAGYVVKNGYRRVTIGGKTHPVHRLIWVRERGEWPQEIDHINGDRSDNRIENLRSVSRLENMRNRKTQSNNKSGVTGVYWAAWGNCWSASIRVMGKHRFLGRFPSLEEAVAARQKAEKEIGFHENHGRTA